MNEPTPSNRGPVAAASTVCARPKRRTRSALALSLPTQHGAWTTLIACFLTGALTAPRPTVGLLILLAGLLAVFFSQHGTGRWLKLPASDHRRSALLGLAGAYALIAVVSAGHLAVNQQLWLLVPGAVVGGIVFASSLWLEDRRKDHTVGGEILGMFGLTLACPAAFYVATGELGPIAIALWLVTGVFYAGSVLRVRLQVRGFKARAASFTSRVGAAGLSAAFHLGAFALVSTLCESGRLPQGMQLAVTAPALESLWGVIHRPTRRLHVRNIGFKELGYSVVFLVVAVIAFRTAL